MRQPYSILFQSAKLGDLAPILSEFGFAAELLQESIREDRIYGLSGGVLPALAYALAFSARLQSEKCGKAINALQDFRHFLASSRSSQIRHLNLPPTYGRSNLKPLRSWLNRQLMKYCGKSDLRFSELPVSLYLCALDGDATITFFGKPDETLQFEYQYVRVGPPQDAPVVDAVIAALSTMVSTEPALVNGRWYRDCRPAIADAGAILSDLESSNPRHIIRTIPFTYVRPWKTNFISSSFIMHSFIERNQTLLAEEYLQQRQRNRELLERISQKEHHPLPCIPGAFHIQLPYIGSTEAATNMRDSVAHKDALMEKFRNLLVDQLHSIPFDQPSNLIYGAGGFSGILAGIVAAKAIDAGLKRDGGSIQQVYGVSAGVINGFFHAMQLAALREPQRFRPEAQSALMDLEQFVACMEPKKIVKFNWNPLRLWRGWANLEPLQAFLTERLAAYTGSSSPESLTFDNLALPMTVTVANPDGFSYFLGMSNPQRRTEMGGHTFEVWNAPIIDSLIAGWSMNTYIEPHHVLGYEFQDGGGPFYDIGFLVARMDQSLTNQINVHLDDPEGHSYNIPERPDIFRVILDTHNYSFPEERRRMLLLTNLFYENERLERAINE